LRPLGDEAEVGLGGERRHQREIAAVATHHFDDERPLVGLGRGGDRVNCLNNFSIISEI
jgi:hypothetical protein